MKSDLSLRLETSEPASGLRPERFDSGLIFLALLALYAVTMPPDISGADAGEVQTVPFMLGIMHGPGMPLYVLTGWLFSHAFALGNVAWRLTFLSGICTAATAVLLYVTANELGCRRFTAVATAGIYGTAVEVWVHATLAATQTLATLFAAACTLATVKWWRAGTPGWYLLMWLSAGLAIATHPFALYLCPGALVVTIAGRTRLPRLLLFSGPLLCAVSLGLYFYSPLRSVAITNAHADPVMASGFVALPTLLSVPGIATLEGFAHFLNAGPQFGSSLTVWAPLEVTHYPDYLVRLSTIAAAGGVAALLIPFGLFKLRRGDPVLVAALSLNALAIVPFSVRYWGSFDPQKYCLLSVWLFGLAIAIGATAIVELTASEYRRIVATAIALGFILQIGTNIVSRWDEQAGHREDRWGRSMIADAARETAPHSVIIAEWMIATPLSYGEYIDGSLGDRLVAIWTPRDSSVVRHWLQSRRVYYAPSEPPAANATLPRDIHWCRLRSSGLLLYEAFADGRCHPAGPSPISTAY